LKKSAPAQRAGVTAKGVWAAVPQYSPAPRTPPDANAAVAKPASLQIVAKPVPYP
jgi:hypothetical protein